MTHSLGFIFTYLSPLIQREAHDNYKRRFWNWKAYSLTSSSSILSPIPPLKILIWTHMCGTLVFLFLLATLYFWRISFNCAHQNHTSSMLNWFCLVYVSIWIWEKLCMRTSSRATSEYPTVSSGRIGLERLSRVSKFTHYFFPPCPDGFGELVEIEMKILCMGLWTMLYASDSMEWSRSSIGCRVWVFNCGESEFLFLQVHSIHTV